MVCCVLFLLVFIFFFLYKQKTAYEFRISDWSSDVCSSDLLTERDGMFDYLGLQTLYDRYFIHSNKTRFELPQACFMRVAMGLAMNEIDREARAIEFYTLLSSFDFMSRSDERLVGTEAVSPGSLRWSPNHSKKNRHET